MAGILNDFSVFISILVIYFINTQVACSVGIMISVSMPNVSTALPLLMPIVILTMLYSGVFLNTE